ncbi:MAG TPA: hypothetical protein VFA09_18455 [Ktedonobacteraceae bacterium]|nr:hypothetical protein [Ktedonobacteraceae bacterium]
MKDQQDQQPQDDFEVEITDLDEQLTDTDEPRRGRLIAPTADLSASVLLRLSQKAQLLLRHRRYQLLITTSLAVLAILVILANTTGIRDLLAGGSVVPLSSPAASGPQNDLFYFQLNPPWGHLSIDGHTVTHVPTAVNQPALSLSPGLHKLLWQAAPFRPVSCILIVPVISNPSTCNHSQFTPNNSNQLVSLVELRVSTDLLAPVQRAALLAATQAALNQEQHSQIVLPGEAYAVPSEVADAHPNGCKLVEQAVLCFTTAQQPLRATLSFQLDTDTSYNAPCSDPNICSLNGFDCRLFCSVTDLQWPDAPPIVSDNSAWDAIAVVHSTWHYTTLTGQTVASNEADSFVGGTQNEHFLSLAITWDGTAWHASLLSATSPTFFFVPVCNSAIGDAQNLVNDVATNNTQIGLSLQSAYGSDPSVGCLIEVSWERIPSATPTPTSTTPLPPAAYLLHRFGVMIAANAQAHKLWPFLPVADANEQHAVQQLMPLLAPGEVSVG